MGNLNIKTIPGENMDTLVQKKAYVFSRAITQNILLSLMRNKNLIRKLCGEHDIDDFGHSIIAGTMRRMHKGSKMKGYSVCDYYTVSQKSETSF